MGLDITAYSKVEKVDVAVDEKNRPLDDSVYDEYARVWATGKRGQNDSLEDGKFYDYKDRFGFPAGSYSGYGEWRETLAKLAGYPLTPYKDFFGESACHAAACWGGATGAFAELIDFPDNEGCLGPVTSAKLAKDFAEFEERARYFDGGEDGWFYKKYLYWKEAFELASDDGMVRFH
jgi:hypothetical protein